MKKKKKGDSLNEVVRATQESIASISSVAKQRSHYTHPSYWIEIGSSHMGIKLGEEMSYRDLLYGMLVASANDAANVIAFNIGEGSIPTFMDQLNTYLKQLGCQNTHFNNPHGLFHPKHKTTVYDMALITREALKEPLFRQIVSTVKCMRPPTNKQPSIPLVQTNRLLKKGPYYYPYAIGVKTGYTSDAQHTFVGAAKKDQRSLIAVLFKCKERGEIFQDCIQLFEWAFSEEKIRKVLIKEGPQKFVLNIQGAIKEIHTVTNQEIVTEFFPSEEPKIKCLLHWENIQPPVKKGQKVGFLMLSASDGLFNQSVDLFAEEDVPETFQHWLETVVLTQGYLKSIVLFLGIFLILGGTIYWVIRRKR